MKIIAVDKEEPLKAEDACRQRIFASLQDVKIAMKAYRLFKEDKETFWIMIENAVNKTIEEVEKG